MLKKIVDIVLNWVLTAIVLPTVYTVVNYFKMKKTIKELNEEINRLKNAKTKSDIDSSIDDLR